MANRFTWSKQNDVKIKMNDVRPNHTDELLLKQLNIHFSQMSHKLVVSIPNLDDTANQKKGAQIKYQGHIPCSGGTMDNKSALI